MTALERKLLAIEIAKEIAKQSDELMSMEDIKKMFGVKTNEAIYAKINAGLPSHKRDGIGRYFFKSEIMKYLKGE